MWCHHSTTATTEFPAGLSNSILSPPIPTPGRSNPSPVGRWGIWPRRAAKDFNTCTTTLPTVLTTGRDSGASLHKDLGTYRPFLGTITSTSRGLATFSRTKHCSFLGLPEEGISCHRMTSSMRSSDDTTNQRSSSTSQWRTGFSSRRKSLDPVSTGCPGAMVTPMFQPIPTTSIAGRWKFCRGIPTLRMRTGRERWTSARIPWFRGSSTSRPKMSRGLEEHRCWRSSDFARQVGHTSILNARCVMSARILYHV